MTIEKDLNPHFFFIAEKCLRRGGSFTDGTYKDGLCHGMNNIYECDFDGGDYCLPVTYHSFCDTNLQTCNCHLMGMMAPGLIGHSQMEGILSQSICYSHWVNGAWNGVISIRQSSVFNHEKVGIWQSHLAAQKELLLPLSFLIIKLIKLNLSKLHYGPHFEPHCRTKCCVIRENNITAPIMNPIKDTLVPLRTNFNANGCVIWRHSN